MVSASSRVPSGIFGLDRIIDGGFVPNTVNCVLGMPGTGKSWMTLQFLLRNIYNGKKAIYFTLEEQPEKIVRFAQMMGFSEIKRFIDEKKLLFVWMKGRDFKKFVTSELASIAKKFKDSDLALAVDPLTPMTWEISSMEQRDLIGMFFRTLRGMGTSVVTVEEYGQTESVNLSESLAVPLYLADAVVHLRYLGVTGAYNRSMKMIKMRGSKHGEDVYPIFLISGLGMLVQPDDMESVEDMGIIRKDLEDLSEKAGRLKGANEKVLSDKVALMKKGWTANLRPKEFVDDILDWHGIKKSSKSAE